MNSGSRIKSRVRFERVNKELVSPLAVYYYYYCMHVYHFLFHNQSIVFESHSVCSPPFPDFEDIQQYPQQWSPSASTSPLPPVSASVSLTLTLAITVSFCEPICFSTRRAIDPRPCSSRQTPARTSPQFSRASLSQQVRHSSQNRVLYRAIFTFSAGPFAQAPPQPSIPHAPPP